MAGQRTGSTMKFLRLFEPITIKNCVIPNRIVMPAMGLFYTDDYTFNERFRAFYRERAEGGVGLMIVGPMAVDLLGAGPFMPGLFDDRNDEALSRFIAEVHRDTGTRVATQLFHSGRNTPSLFTGRQPIAPSAVPSALTHEMPRVMTKDDIEEVKESFAAAARRARDVGFDFVEIIACGGYLIGQFLSPVTNLRTDEYGGPLECRMGFGLQVIRRVREAVGDDFPVGIRIAGHDYVEGGHTNRESALFAAEAVNAGVDAINVTGGWHEARVPQITANVPPGAYVYLARGVKEKVSVPVFASNRLGDPVVAEKALRSGGCDMVCMARPLIADPSLPRKVREGRLDKVVSCISCNQGCFDALFSGRAVGCVLNPRAGREWDLTVTQSSRKKRILVAGGGPAGMTFALTAASRGHDVTLVEKDAALGGQVNLAKAPPGKKEFGKLTDSMARRLSRAHVSVHCNVEATPESLGAKGERYDLVVVSSGAEPLRLRIPGIEKPHVVCAWDVLAGDVSSIGNHVVIVGGSATGCETAHYIAEMGTPDPATFMHLVYHDAENIGAAKELLYHSGKTITIIDIIDRFAANVGRSSRWSLLKSLRLMDVKLRPKTKLLEVTDDSVIVETARGEEVIPADIVVLAVGVKPRNDLAEACRAKGIDAVTIGDAASPRNITDAVREGFEEALKA